MNATQQEMALYLQTQMMTAMQQRQTTAKSQSKDGPSFQEQLSQKTMDAPKAEHDQSTEDKTSPPAKTPTETPQDPTLDPYRQQLLAAAQAAAVVVAAQFVDTAPTLTAQPQPQTVQMVQTTPIQPQAGTPLPQVPVAATSIQPVQPQQVQPQPVQSRQIQPQQTETVATVQAEGMPQTRPTIVRQEAPAQGAEEPQAKADQPLEAVRIQPKGEGQEARQSETRPQDQPVEVTVTRSPNKDDQVLAAQAQTEAPVFTKVEAAPVKVGEVPVLDTETGDVETQLAKQVDGLLQKGGDRVELKLNPEHLGAVTVQLTRSQDGSIHVSISTTSERATVLLERNASGLEQLLAGTNRAPVQVEVQRSQDSQHAQSGQQQPQEREGSPGQQQQRQQNQQDRSQDFLQQLRLGLFPAESEVS